MSLSPDSASPRKETAVTGRIEAEEMSPYLWSLLAMLTSTAFLDGFDGAILATVAPFVREQYAFDDLAMGT